MPNRVDTRFKIASITKLLNAVAVAQLADAGKLSFRDPLKKYLPDYPSDATHPSAAHAHGRPRARAFPQREHLRSPAPHDPELLALTNAEPEFKPAPASATATKPRWSSPRSSRRVGVAGKSGSTDGASTRLDFYRQRGFIVVVLSNYDGIGHIAADAIGEVVLRIAH